MKLFFTLLLGLLIVPGSATAQQDAVNPVISASPLCGVLQNQAGYKIYGSISTNYFLDEEGEEARHWDSFTISPGNQIEFCSRGPFFEGERLELTLRTLFPVFSCYTKLDQTLIIESGKDENGDNQTWVNCS